MRLPWQHLRVPLNQIGLIVILRLILSVTTQLRFHCFRFSIDKSRFQIPEKSVSSRKSLNDRCMLHLRSSGTTIVFSLCAIFLHCCGNWTWYSKLLLRDTVNDTKGGDSFGSWIFFLAWTSIWFSSHVVGVYVCKSCCVSGATRIALENTTCAD